VGIHSWRGHSECWTSGESCRHGNQLEQRERGYKALCSPKESRCQRTKNAWTPSQQVRHQRAPATCGQSIPTRHHPPPAPSLRRHMAHGARRLGEDAVRDVNHTVSLSLCSSAARMCRSGLVWPGCRHPPYKASPAPIPPHPSPWLIGRKGIHADVPRHPRTASRPAARRCVCRMALEKEVHRPPEVHNEGMTTTPTVVPLSIRCVRKCRVHKRHRATAARPCRKRMKRPDSMKHIGSSEGVEMSCQQIKGVWEDERITM
jgi:hypothetical protein